jgi:uncharacterized protein
MYTLNSRIANTLLGLSLLTVVSCSQQKNDSSASSEPLNIAALTTNKSLVNTSQSKYTKLQAVGFNDVKLNDGFWAERVNTCFNTMIPEMWSIYSDAEVSHALRNFEIAAGVKEGEHKGAPFHDGDFYKLIEAASMAYAITKDEKFNTMIDEVIPLIRASQRADGYIHTPVMIKVKNNPDEAQEFRDRMDFESYNMGHLMTAATVHYKATGKTELLEIAKKAADYLYVYCQKYPEKMAKNAICPSHYMGVIEMYRTTNDPKYLELAKQFIEIRSLMTEGTDHNQDRIAFREQTKAVGHAVRANYLYAGVADVYAETGDETLKSALDSIWNDLTQTKLYITGGCGALYDGVSPNGTTYDQPSIQQVHQAYGREYELPNAGAHNETCANIGNALWNWRMFQTTAESKYVDLLEHTMYNSVLSGVNLNGKGYFYTNPLSNQLDLPFQLRWPNVREAYISYSNCCPPNTIRTIAEISSYFYSKNEIGIWFNMYGASELNTMVSDEMIALKQTTNYPWEGSVLIEIQKSNMSPISLNFRIPDWCQNATLFINNQKIESSTSGSSYLSVNQAWKEGDQIRLEMEMPVTMVEANPLVEPTRNQVAIKRGPLVYCLEAVDLKSDQKLSNVIIPGDIKLQVEKMNLAGSDIVSLTGKAKLTLTNWSKNLYQQVNNSSTSIDIRLIPYYAWANRASADMEVWLPVSK